MIFLRYWEYAEVQRIFNTESRQKTRDLFLQTHHPFRCIHVDFCKEPGVTHSMITEDHLVQIIQGSSLESHNRLFFIVGEAGSGKSELCQWLEYHLDQMHTLPIYIPRRKTSAFQVATLLYQRLAQHLPEHTMEDVPLDIEAQFITVTATMLLYEHGPHVLKPARDWEAFFAYPQLAKDMVHWLAHRNDNDPYHLDKHILHTWFSQHQGQTSSHIEAIRVALQDILRLAIERRIWLRDIRELLSALSQAALRGGKRPVLLIEDITAFQTIGDLLLDFLLDLTSGHYDAVIGVTTGYEKTQLSRATSSGDLTHIQHRLRARFVLTDESGQSFGLEEDIVDFTRRYLYALQAHSGRRNPFDELYPFTATMLRRAYQALHEDGNPRKTPRLFIEHVLGAVLATDQIPPFCLDASSHLKRVPRLFREEEVGNEVLCSILRWYGEVEQEHIVLDPKIPAWWDIPVPDELVHNDMIRVTRTFASPQLSAATNISTSWEQEIRELQSWLNGGGIYPRRETLKRGIERVMLSLGDPRVLANPFSQSTNAAYVYYARGDERLPICLEDSGDVKSTDTYVQVSVHRDPHDRSLLEELAYLQLSGVAMPQACQNIVLTLTWARRHWNTYHEQVQSLLTQSLGGISLSQLVLVIWRLLAYLQGVPWSTSPHTQPCEHESDGSCSPWNNSEHHACQRTGIELLRWHEPVRRLFIGLFMLRDTFVDVATFQTTQQTTEMMAVLQTLARVPIRPLKSLPYKIRPLGYSLYELLVSAQVYIQALADIDLTTSLTTDIQWIEQSIKHLKAQRTFDPVHFEHDTIFLKLHCVSVGIPWQHEWSQAIAVLQEMSEGTSDQLIHDLQQVKRRGQQLTTERSDLWAYQDFRLQLAPILAHPYWAASHTLHEILITLKQTARARYRRTGKVLTGTKAYQSFLTTLEQLRKEKNSL
jgi:hypothetical protein